MTPQYWSMRIILFLFLISFITKSAFSQQSSKKEMQAQMLEAVNELKKRLSDLEKQIETVKDLEEQPAMLKKQLTMMEEVKKSAPGMSKKTFQQALCEPDKID